MDPYGVNYAQGLGYNPWLVILSCLVLILVLEGIFKIRTKKTE